MPEVKLGRRIVNYFELARFAPSHMEPSTVKERQARERGFDAACDIASMVFGSGTATSVMAPLVEKAREIGSPPAWNPTNNEGRKQWESDLTEHLLKEIWK